jgi:hypothetical protein
MRIMGDPNGVTSEWIPSDRLYELAAELGVGERRLEDWRAANLIPRPKKQGYEGRRPLWYYPPHSARQLEAVVRWRKRSQGLGGILAALWAEGFPIPVEQVRSDILETLDSFERMMREELARFVPKGIDPAELMDKPEALRVALDSYADELARMRSRFPLKRGLRMTLSERRRAMSYWLALLYGLEQDPADAVLVERVVGLSRGRSGRISGDVDWAPEESLPRSPITPRALKQAVSEADADSFRLVGAALESMLKLIRYLAPVLLPTNLRSFSEDAIAFFDEAPAPGIALFAAVQIANVHRTRGSEELPAEYIDAVQVGNALHEFTAEMNPEERRELIDRMRAAKGR